MSIVATCSHCHATFEANERLADKKVRCPKCGEVTRLVAGAATPGATTFRGAPAMSRNLMDDAEIPIKDPLADRAAHSLARRKFRRQATLFGVLLMFVVMIGVGIAIAYEKAQTLKLPTTTSRDAPLPPPPLTERLNWSKYENPEGWSIQFPDVPTESSKDDAATVWLQEDPEMGRFLVEVRNEANDDWNNLTGQIAVAEAKRNVESANLFSVSDRSSHFAGGAQIHRIRLTGDVPMEGLQAAIVYKFSLDGRTYTVLWQGDDPLTSSEVVRYYFITFQKNGSSLLSG
ncbi:zinc-ribbon domain-containing protein [Blastopirellula sp. JC732]|uniref:Zinc-ribbon domain-containing protein n=1 Tax=Blastopirellula sediminis TaxID=2894196 RepID=A0A9X1MPX5_9BACT|nr:zinc-ribbon domain-containing protein [Blastopirellula sediminis]MCC9606492.1 zinc-ribbon domain-containing protein [Blastopirellula sediminis]MCC9630210.1 zinc-ribbon domain-containing protein [Blastopirellula sediminis]